VIACPAGRGRQQAYAIKNFHDQNTPIAIWTAKAVKRTLTAIGRVEARWMVDCTILAPSSQSANGSVTAVLDVMIAIARRPPNIGCLPMSRGKYYDLTADRNA
jgi:hypothetical protein